jgi:maltose alpha-D-glucosyltransferase/alpha-amylase
MGENLDVPGRLSVRTPMQWTPYGSGGFSTATAAEFVRPMPDGEFSIEHVSVARQRSDPDSLLNMIEELMRTRRECPSIGTGKWTALETGQDAVLALRHDVEGCSTVVVNNLGAKRCTVLLDLEPEEIATATDLLGDRRYDPLDPQTRSFRMNGYGYRWLRIGGEY